MKDVAADAHAAAVQIAEVIAQREKIEQTLSRMLVRSISCIYHVRFDSLGEKVCGARRAVANDHHVDSHRFEVSRGVDQRFALQHARPGRGDIHGVGRQPLFGELEGDPCAGRALEEKIDDRRAAKGRDFFYRALADLLERLSGIENEKYLFARQGLEAKKVLAERTCHGSSSAAGTTTTAVRPSSSSIITSTRSPGSTSTRLPTMSAWIGSSRPPRSTN